MAYSMGFSIQGKIERFMRRGLIARGLLTVAALVLVAGLTFANRAVKAQTSETAKPAVAAETPRAAGAEAQKPGEAKQAAGEKKDEGKGDENDVFRHSAMVQKIAKALNLDVETVARGAEIINFLIVIFAIGIPLFKILPKTLKNRRAALSKSLEDARAVSVDAQTRLAAVEVKLKSLGQEIESFKVQAESETATDEARIKASIEEERTRIVAQASQEIEQAAAHAERKLRQFAAEIALDRAVSKLKLDEATDKELIAEFIADVTSTTANSEGGKR